MANSQSCGGRPPLLGSCGLGLLPADRLAAASACHVPQLPNPVSCSFLSTGMVPAFVSYNVLPNSMVSYNVLNEVA